MECRVPHPMVENHLIRTSARCKFLGPSLSLSYRRVETRRRTERILLERISLLYAPVLLIFYARQLIKRAAADQDILCLIRELITRFPI